MVKLFGRIGFKLNMALNKYFDIVGKQIFCKMLQRGVFRFERLQCRPINLYGNTLCNRLYGFGTVYMTDKGERRCVNVAFKAESNDRFTVVNEPVRSEAAS